MIDKLVNFIRPTQSTVYDTESLTTLESISKTIEKINELIDNYNTFTENTNKTVDEQNNIINDLKILIDNARNDLKALNLIYKNNEEFLKNNEVATLLDLNNLIIELNNKMGKNDLIQLSQLSQEIKELMTGGNVAVVGENTILSKNIVNNQVTKEKLHDYKVVGEFINLPSSILSAYDGYYLNSTSHEKVEDSNFKLYYIKANNEGINLRIKNVKRIDKFSKNVTPDNFIENVGEDISNIEYFLNDGEILALSVDKRTNTPIMEYAPFYYLNNLYTDFSKGFNKLNKNNVSFLEKKQVNLFNGEFTNTYLTNPSNSEQYSLLKKEGYKTLIIPILPNTNYTILKDKVQKDGDYYYFKVATFTEDIDYIKETVIKQSIIVSGSIRYDNTSEDITRYNFTSGENDNTLVVTVAKSYSPYVEILKGNYFTYQANSYDYFYNPVGINIYSKNEVNEMVENLKGVNKIQSNNGGFDITLGNKTYYHFKHNVNDTINLDTFMLTMGKVGTKTIWNGTDIEAPIKEKNQIDFIGGVHGDERYTKVTMIIDGIIQNIETEINTSFKNLTIYVESTLFRCNTNIPVFLRYKKLEFTNNKLIISNTLHCLVNDFIVERYTGSGLYSVYKKDVIGYTTNTSNRLINNEGLPLNKNLDEGIFYGNDFTIRVKQLGEKNQYYMGNVTNFNNESEPRFKFYFDTINSPTGVLLKKNEEINAMYEIEVI